LAWFHARSNVDVDGEPGVTPYPVCAKVGTAGKARVAIKPIKAMVLSMVLFLESELFDSLRKVLTPRSAYMNARGRQTVAAAIFIEGLTLKPIMRVAR
jgi:hypothetical protein